MENIVTYTNLKITDMLSRMCILLQRSIILWKKLQLKRCKLWSFYSFVRYSAWITIVHNLFFWIAIIPFLVLLCQKNVSDIWHISFLSSLKQNSRQTIKLIVLLLFWNFLSTSMKSPFSTWHLAIIFHFMRHYMGWVTKYVSSK